MIGWWGCLRWALCCRCAVASHYEVTAAYPVLLCYCRRVSDMLIHSPLGVPRSQQPNCLPCTYFIRYIPYLQICKHDKPRYFVQNRVATPSGQDNILLAVPLRIALGYRGLDPSNKVCSDLFSHSHNMIEMELFPFIESHGTLLVSSARSS